MSKFVWVFNRGDLPNFSLEKVLSICRELVPDNIPLVEPLIEVSENFCVGVSNPKNNFRSSENGFMLGALVGEYPNWDCVGSEYPDGSYALFRQNDNCIEVLSDPAGSRTIWYFFDQEKLLLSSSQLAIVRYLGDFNLNPTAVAWMISSGTIGPKDSWDNRLRRMEPNCIMTLNRHSWTLSLSKESVEFNEDKKSEDFYFETLTDSLNSIFDRLVKNNNFENWVLPLSGGYDSRALLYYLKSHMNSGLKALTWGVLDSLENPKSDSSIARILAKDANIEHVFYPTDPELESLEILFNRFIKNGEGRVESISGYLDGFKIWKDLHLGNVQGTFRGDVGWPLSGFGVFSFFDARKTVGLISLGDFTNIARFREFFNGVDQSLPEFLQPKKGESPDRWRDRLYHSFRIPTVLAALSDLKLSYLEQVTPFLSKEILSQIRKHPRKLRNNKYLFRKLVISMYPNVPFAEESAQMSVKSFVNDPKVSDFLRGEILVRRNNVVFPSFLIDDVLLRLESKSSLSSKEKVRSRSKMKFLFPENLFNTVKKVIKRNETFGSLNIDSSVLALRVYLVLKTFELFDNNLARMR